MPITRRRLLATAGAGVAGAGAATLAACGSDADEPSSERDVELLQTALDAERSVTSLYESAAEQRLEPEVTEALGAFGNQTDTHVERLTDAIESAGGEAAESSERPEGAESAVEAIALALDEAIGAYNAAVGELSTAELRRTVFELMTSDAAQLAAVSGFLGEDPAPDAFVTGGTREPAAEEG